jgi:hypothetical protein
MFKIWLIGKFWGVIAFIRLIPIRYEGVLSAHSMCNPIKNNDAIKRDTHPYSHQMGVGKLFTLR